MFFMPLKATVLGHPFRGRRELVVAISEEQLLELGRQLFFGNKTTPAFEDSVCGSTHGSVLVALLRHSLREDIAQAIGKLEPGANLDPPCVGPRTTHEGGRESRTERCWLTESSLSWQAT